MSVSFIQFRGLLALQSNRVCDDMKCCKCVADRRAQFEKLEYTEEDYQEELEHI